MRVGIPHRHIKGLPPYLYCLLRNGHPYYYKNISRYTPIDSPSQYENEVYKEFYGTDGDPQMTIILVQVCTEFVVSGSTIRVGVLFVGDYKFQVSGIIEVQEFKKLKFKIKSEKNNSRKCEKS